MILWGLDNFLTSLYFFFFSCVGTKAPPAGSSCSATRAATRIYHVL